MWDECKCALQCGKRSKRVLPNSACIHRCCYSVTKSCDSLWPHGIYYARFPCPSLSPGVCSNSCPSSQRCYPTISSRHRAQEMLAEWIHKCRVNLILLSFFINSDLHLGELKMKLGVQVSIIWFPPHLPIGKNAFQPLWMAFIHPGSIYTWIHRKAWGLQGPQSIVVMLPQQIVHLSFSEPEWLLIYQSLYTKNIHLSFAGTCVSQPWIFHAPFPPLAQLKINLILSVHQLSS